jgi:hypothetical protein
MDTTSSLTKFAIPVTNRYAPLSIYNEQQTLNDRVPRTRTTYEQEFPSLRNCKSVKRSRRNTTFPDSQQTKGSGSHIKRNLNKNLNKIIILGDSHARGCAQEVQHNLGHDFEVQGIVKPGADSEIIVNTSTKITGKLTKKDIVVVWGGTRDVGRNETGKAIHQIKKFVKKQTNVIVMNVPCRHDLEPNSCVNDEVKVYNRKLKKHLKVFGNTCNRNRFK